VNQNGKRHKCKVVIEIVNFNYRIYLLKLTLSGGRAWFLSEGNHQQKIDNQQSTIDNDYGIDEPLDL